MHPRVRTAATVVRAAVATSDLPHEARRTLVLIDRGARRILTGRDRARFWSPDHYRSFSRIEGSGP